MVDFVTIPLSNTIVIHESKIRCVRAYPRLCHGKSTSYAKQDLPFLAPVDTVSHTAIFSIIQQWDQSVFCCCNKIPKAEYLQTREVCLGHSFNS